MGSKKGRGCNERKGAKRSEDGQNEVISGDRDAVTDSSFGAVGGGWSKSSVYTVNHVNSMYLYTRPNICSNR